MQEEFLGMVGFVGSKGAEALCAKNCNVLQEKGDKIENMRFNGIDGANTISGKYLDCNGIFVTSDHIPN